MRIGLMADTHDRLPAIAELLGRMASSGVGMVLHAGDFCSPFALRPFHDTRLALAGVFGRNDGDREGLKASAAAGVGTELYESPHSIELAGKQIILVHDLGEINSRSVLAHQIVIHGCSHRPDVRERGDALLINPGEACGWLNGTPTAAILDLETLHIETIALDGPEWRY
jgi:putative phosphoesterase